MDKKVNEIKEPQTEIANNRQSEIMTLSIAAGLLQTTERLLSEKIKAGLLKAYKVGKRIYVLESELIEFIKLHPHKAK